MTSIGLSLMRFMPLNGGMNDPVNPPLSAFIEGASDGFVESEQTLTTGILGLSGAELISHRWYADGVLLPEETDATFTPIATVNVADGAVLQYVPMIDGAAYGSQIVTLMHLPEVEPAQALPRLFGVQRMGETITLDTSMLSNVSGIRYFLDGAEIQGQTGTSIMVAFMGTLKGEVTCDQGVLMTPALRILHNHTMADHNDADDAVLGLVPHSAATHIALSDGSWSDPMTWDVKTVPADSARVLVPVGAVVTYDLASSARLDTVRVDGTLTMALDRSTSMLVETLVVQPMGHLVIGAGRMNGLPEAHTCELTISNRAYALDPDNPTNLDIGNDPTLVGRGILNLGTFTAFGHHRAPKVWTADNSLPVAGDTSVTLKEVPFNWAAGDTVIIPSTINNVASSGVATRYDEERVITDITGTTVSWDAGQPLLYDHDAQNDTVTDRPDLSLPIVNKERNIILRSEAGAAIAQRGHVMSAHMASDTDLWDVAFIELGRTNKSIPTGEIDANGDFRFNAIGVRDSFTTEPLTATSNIKARYPFHTHFVGFSSSKKNIIRDCFVEDARAWGMVHHSGRVDWIGNTVYRAQGAGMVSETADEQGVWDNNLVCGLDSICANPGHVKGAEEQEGLSGDPFRRGYGFAWRGRALVMTRNVAVGMAYGHVFYHRSIQNGFSDVIKLNRKDTDLHDLAWLSEDDPIGTIGHSPFPISHYKNNKSIGCGGALIVVKTASMQAHDFPILIDGFQCWACHTGISYDYVGTYITRDADLTASKFQAQTMPGSTFDAGILITKTDLMSFDNVVTRGFGTGLMLDASQPPGSNNTGYNTTTSPKTIIANHTSIDDGVVQAETGDGDPVANTLLRIDNYTPLAAPVVDLPFILGDFVGNQSEIQNYASGTKTDSVSTGSVLPKPNETAGLLYGYPSLGGVGWGNYSRRILDLLLEYGYWTYNGDRIVLTPLYFSDRITGKVIKRTHAVKIIPELNANYTNLGGFIRSSVGPTANNVARVVTAGTTDSFNILSASNAAGQSGTTLTLGDPWMTALWGQTPAHLKPNYGALTVAENGDVAYAPREGYIGPDSWQAYVYDGQGRWATVEVMIDVQAV